MMPSRDDVLAFWAWFETVAAQLATRLSDPDLLDELDDRVARLGGDVMWEVGPGIRAACALTITPDGNRERLPVTRFIASLAPTIPGWEIHHAKPPKAWRLMFTIKSEAGRTFDVDANAWRYVLFRFPEGDFDIIVEEPGSADLTDDLRYVAATIVLDGLLGEELRLRCFREIEPVVALAEDVAGKASPIATLADHLRSVRAS